MPQQMHIAILCPDPGVSESIQSALAPYPHMTISGFVKPSTHWFHDAMIQDATHCVLAGDTEAPNLAEKTQQLLKSHPQIHAIAVYEEAAPKEMGILLQSGAKAVIPKRYLPSHLAVAIDQTMKDRVYVKTGPDYEPIATDTDTPFEKLSQREKDVLQLISYGYTYQDIADKLDISIKSVETYRSRISQKLELDSRAKMVRYALDVGLLDKNLHV